MPVTSFVRTRSRGGAALLRLARIVLAIAPLAVLPAPAEAQPAAPTPVTFPEALQRAATELFGRAAITGDRIELVIDPLIDAASGAQSAATRAMQQRLVEIVRTSYPRFVVQPFTPEVLARNPVVLVGTFTAISQAGNEAPSDAFRICLSLADLASRTVVAKGVARATPEDVDVTPTPYFRDVPVWAKDQATDAYVKTCQGTPMGGRLDPAYVDRLPANALIQDGIAEYEAQRFREALAFYRTARKLPGGDQHRVRVGTYLANAKLGRRDDAVDAFGDLVDYGLSTEQLSVRLLFRPGSTQFIDNPQTTEPYPMWLSQIATRVRQKNACLEIVGHTSRTGPPSLNERLSVLRAQFIMDLLLTGMPDGRSRMIASGRGFRDNLVGTGKDDASDALDRRVEFKVIGC
ncbi:OmpA family protein [Bosea sp. (in: a-proteobacteria)]|uniref:OmpA family protein n=1 Tax=Bosea sp. (in: a-proteobacteria) TaxID=1871050 RepID=UPI003F6F3A28